MSNDPFQSFLDLIEFDQTILSLRNEYSGIEESLDTIARQEMQLNDELAREKNEVQEAQFGVDEKELEMKVLDDLERDKKRKLDHVSSPREYQVLTSEINTLKKQQHDLEETVLSAWHNLESAKRAFQDLNKNIEEKKAALADSKNNLLQQSQTVKLNLENRERERSSYLSAVPEEWLEKYRAMRERVSDPVVPVQYDSCSACFSTILEKDLALLRKRALLQCKTCFRFLYLPEARKQAAE